jgi:cob(I)alamin adenosyltransferase
MKIYTRKGDDGTTGLIGGVRVKKHHLRVDSYGTVDELNAHIGLVRSKTAATDILTVLSGIQDRLFVIGSMLASAKGSKMLIPDLHMEDIEVLEKAIDKMDETLPALENFILPGASVRGSELHIARCVCRRAERLVVALDEAEEGSVDPLVVQYLNRLSDYLFTLARFADHEEGGFEIPWRPRKG